MIYSVYKWEPIHHKLTPTYLGGSALTANQIAARLTRSTGSIYLAKPIRRVI